MTQLTIIRHGETAAVVLPDAVLESIGLRISRSADQLARLAQRVRDDIRAGRVTSGGFDQL
jgi:antitoxin component of MazEF toxin-antitoxin module